MSYWFIKIIELYRIKSKYSNWRTFHRKTYKEITLKIKKIQLKLSLMNKMLITTSCRQYIQWEKWTKPIAIQSWKTNTLMTLKTLPFLFQSLEKTRITNLTQSLLCVVKTARCSHKLEKTLSFMEIKQIKIP